MTEKRAGIPGIDRDDGILRVTPTEDLVRSQTLALIIGYMQQTEQVDALGQHPRKCR